MSCTLSGSSCVCPATFQTSDQGQGSYTVSGTNLIDGDGNSNPYCVSGDTLLISGQSNAGALTYVLRRVTR